MSPLVETLLTTLLVTIAAMVVLWLIGIARRDVSIVDLFWGLGFVIVAWIALTMNQPTTSRVWLLAGLTTVWGLRLSIHLTVRNWGHGEDRRYAAMRRHHGERFHWVSLYTVFLLQAVILWFVSLPLQVAAVRHPQEAFGMLDGLGIIAWTVGFIFEAVGDRQLAQFKVDPRNAGRVMDRGLWRYTRHPNYFGDFCIWWGLYFTAAAGGAGATIASPLLMSVLLLKVSGVTLLEADITDRRPDYADYQRSTNAFFPGPPKGKH